jgi:hypothetical protein
VAEEMKMFCKHCDSESEYKIIWDRRKRARAKCCTCNKWIKRISRKTKVKDQKCPKLRAYLRNALAGQMKMQAHANRYRLLRLGMYRTEHPHMQAHREDDLIQQLLGCLTSKHVLMEVIKLAKEEGIIDDTISET